MKRVYDALSGKMVVALNEAALSAFVRGLLSGAEIQFESEVKLSTGDRIDFVVDRIGLELKIKGSWPAVLRQVERYTLSDKIDAVLVVTTKRRLAINSTSLNGKPIRAIVMGAF